MTVWNPETVGRLKSELMQLEGVQAVGESQFQGEPCIKVYFDDEDSLQRASIARCDGIPVVLVVAGKIKKQL